MKKLLFFDLDGTLKLKNKKISKNLLDFFTTMWRDGMYTTLITGKAYHWLNVCLKEDLLKIVNPKLCVGVENGSKAVSLRGDILYSKTFSYEDLKFLSKFVLLNSNSISFVAFSPGNEVSKGKICVFDRALLGIVSRKYAESYDISLVSHKEFANLLNLYKPGMIALKAKAPVEFFPFISGFEISLNEGYIDINPKGVNKAYFVSKVSEMMNVNFVNIAVVGNDSNDYPMFKLKVGRKIFVLNERKRESVSFNNIFFCENPEELIGAFEGF